VVVARTRQLERFKDSGIFCNAQMSARQVKNNCRVSESSRLLLKNAVSRLGLSARSFDRILKVSRTLADLADQDAIAEDHVAEAIGYRSFDRPAEY
jgi:magnesium chelatase family protein